jgi:SET domain-containing protein
MKHAALPLLVVVRRSKIQGRGVYAARVIREGKRIIEYTGLLITNEEADAQCDDEGMRRHHTFLFGVDDEFTVDGANGGNEARFINHSCEPNCESVIEGRHVFIDALRDIEAGEEIAYDYWYTTDGGYTLEDLRRIYPCRCGAATCRGTLARPPRRRRKAV